MGNKTLDLIHRHVHIEAVRDDLEIPLMDTTMTWGGHMNTTPWKGVVCVEHLGQVRRGGNYRFLTCRLL